jgi:hypothetical protein
MRYVLVALLALGFGVAVTLTALRSGNEPVDPIQTILLQLKTQAIIEHERQIAIWYRVCPEVVGVNPQLFVAWPGKLSYELPLGDVRIERRGAELIVSTGAIRADEPALPTDFMDYLSTDPLFNFANESELINREVQKASPIARYLTTYYLRRDATLREDFEREVRELVMRIAGAIDAGITTVTVKIAATDAQPLKLPALELCAGSAAAVNGLPFAKIEDGYTIPIGFAPQAKPQGIASLFPGGP